MAISIGSATSADVGSSAGTVINWTAGISGNQLRYMVMFAGYRGSTAEVSGVRFNGVNAAYGTSVRSGASETGVAAYLIPAASLPPAGTYAAQITMSANAFFGGAAIEIYEVDLSSPRGSTTAYGITATGASGTVGTDSAERIIDFMAKKYTDASDGLIVAGGGQTQILTDKSTSASDGDNVYFGVSSQPGTAPAGTMAWSWTSGNRFMAHVIMAFNEGTPVPFAGFNQCIIV